ncbi:TPA: phage tail protein [Pseudomonas aeruginosa]|nr:phage tail protein [Pseudomonas aeruginosa]HBO8619017.1 phage tail protein [Pseudomonas aeruginosa]HCG1028617.1 phage tail protein [Pseudomonas aeruginosa]
MAWYSAGTVAVTANSPTVTGTGTQFSSNARVGDAFRGPDGCWYEVANVASSTVISIKPNYQGSTASGQPYAVAPILGYDKDLSDRFNQIAMDWGATLAGIKPWAIASTGSQAQADMGITEVGRAINGASTVGNALGFLGGVSKTQAPMALDMDTVNESGWFSITPNTYNVPLGNNNISGVNGHVALSMVFDASTRYQLFFVRNTNLPEVWYRSCTNGTWKEWVRFYTTDNIVGSVTRRLVTGKPTGAVMESGTTSNGWYVRFADGTQMAAARSEPGLSFGANVIQLPAAFVTGFNTGVTCNWIPSSGWPATAGQGVRGAYLNGSSSVSFATAQALGANDTITVMAVGRWY